MGCAVFFPLLDLNSQQSSALGRLHTIMLFVSGRALKYFKLLVGTLKELGGFPLRRPAGRDFGNWI